jgi:hypothetical protein
MFSLLVSPAVASFLVSANRRMSGMMYETVASKEVSTYPASIFIRCGVGIFFAWTADGQGHVYSTNCPQTRPFLFKWD